MKKLLVILSVASSFCLNANPTKELDAARWRQIIEEQSLVVFGENHEETWAPALNPKADLSRLMRFDGRWLSPSGANVSEWISEPLASVVRTELDVASDSALDSWSRVEVVVRGDHPYRLVFDDISSSSGPGVFDWALSLPDAADARHWYFRSDAGQPYRADTILSQQKTVDGRATWIPDNLLARALNFGGGDKAFHYIHEQQPALNWPGYISRFGSHDNKRARRHYFVPGRADAPAFKMMLYPNDGLWEQPKTFWQDDRRKLVIQWKDQVDEIQFATEAKTRTSFALRRVRGRDAGQVVAFGMAYVPDEVGAKGQLIGHWSFDRIEGGVVADESGRGHHGRLSGGARATPGISGSGLDPVTVPGLKPGEVFAIRDAREEQPPVTIGRMVIPGEALDSVVDAMTVSMWYSGPPVPPGHNFSAYHPGRTGACLFSVGGDPSPGQVKELWNSNFYLDIKSGWQGDSLYLAAAGHGRILGMRGTSVGSPDSWHHLALTIDKETVKYYLDGTLVLETKLPRDASFTLRKGEDIHVADGLWGRIDELRVHDYALSGPEIEALYRSDGLGLKSEVIFAGKPAPESNGGAEIAWRDENGFHIRMENIELLQEGGVVTSAKFTPDSRLTMPDELMRGKPNEGITAAMRIRFDNLNGRVPILSANTRTGLTILRWGNKIWCTVWGQEGAWSTLEIEANRWYDLVVARGPRGIRIYIDGEPAGGRDFFTENIDLVNAVTLGNEPTSQNASFAGEIKHVRLFNHALPDEAVKKLFHSNEVEPTESNE